MSTSYEKSTSTQASPARALLELIEATGPGKLTLSLYKADGLCWNKRGELRVTDALIDQLRGLANE